MAQNRLKGMAGMGGRGKDKPRNRQDQATAKKARSPKRAGDAKPGPKLSKPAASPRANQKRNQDQWHQAKRMAQRY